MNICDGNFEQYYGRTDMTMLNTNKIYGSLGIRESMKYIERTLEGEGSLTLPYSIKSPFELFELQGDSVQNKTTGKNLWDNSTFVRGHVIDTGEIVGDEKDNYGTWLINAPQDGVYWVWCSAESPNGLYLAYLYNTELLRPFIRVGKGKKMKITLKKGKNYISASGYIEQSQPSIQSTGKEQIMLCLCETEPIIWEDYTGGKPSPSPSCPQEITNSELKKIRITGKNLWLNFITDLTMKNGTTIKTNSDGTFIIYKVSGDTINIEKQLDLPAGQYVLSNGLKSGSADVYIQVNYINDEGVKKIATTYNKNYAFFKYKGGTVTLVLYASNSSDVEFMTLKPQLEIGSTPTLYKPYQEPQLVTLSPPVTLSKWDRIEKRDGQFGVVNKTNEIILNEKNEYYMGYVGSNEDVSVFFIAIEEKKKGKDNIYCDKLIYSDASWGVAGKPYTFSGHPNNPNIYIRVMPNMTKVTELKQWLSQNNIKIIFETESETFTPLLKETQMQLDSLETYDSITNIFVEGGEVDAGIKVTYRASGNETRKV